MSDSSQIRLSAIAVNFTQTHMSHFDGVAFRKHESAGFMLSKIWREFLIVSRNYRHDPETSASIATYFSDPLVLLQADAGKSLRDGVALPKPTLLKMSVGACLERRKSVRQFTGDPITGGNLSALLKAGAGVTHTSKASFYSSDEEKIMEFRAAPSGGGLYPVDLVVAVRDVSSIQSGVYKYVPSTDCLETLGDASISERLFEAFNVPEEIVSVSRSAAIFFFIATPQRSTQKYGPRGLRHVFVEAGAMAENIHLAATALGVGSMDCASFLDAEVSSILELDGVEKSPVHSVLIGETG